MSANPHWKWFEDFCRYEFMAGGPDPHMTAVVEMAKDLPRNEQIWLATVYVGVYNAPTAESIWRAFPRQPDHDVLAAWISEHWAGLRLRTERRTVKAPDRLAYFLTTACDEQIGSLPRDADYEELWQYATNLWSIGRFSAMKLTEVWHRMGLVRAVCPDIRARGGWSPRVGLTYLYPDSAHEPEDDSPYYLSQAELLANDVLRAFRPTFPDLTIRVVEIMLCDYKQCYSGKKQYPGKSMDSELGYEAHARNYWGQNYESKYMAVRPKITAPWALGELMGWTKVRKELGHVLSKYGYMWSDSLYDYLSTTDLANPVKWELPRV